jgi:hypothetical protein
MGTSGPGEGAFLLGNSDAVPRGRPGVAFLAYGPLSGTVSPDATFRGLYGAYAGGGVSGAGDVDADGFPDLLVSGGDGEWFGGVWLVPSPYAP